MPIEAIPKMPGQFERPLKDYVAAYEKFQEMRKRPGADVQTLDDVWRKNQGAVLELEASLIRLFGKRMAEEMLQAAVGVRTLPRVE